MVPSVPCVATLVLLWLRLLWTQTSVQWTKQLLQQPAFERFKSTFNSAKGKGGGALRQIGVQAAAGIAGVSDPNQLLALSRGQIYNPNVELLYKGPKIRSFSFNYSFVPKSAQEAAAVNAIIKEFRTWSAPATSASVVCLIFPTSGKLLI